MKIDRLMAITIYLLNHGKTSAQTLAERFEVSVRTIMRDMDTLGQAGIPIQSSFGSDGGFSIADTYVMEKQLANDTDYRFIVTALKGLASAYTNKNMEQTLAKMNSLTDVKDNPVSVDFSVAHENQEINEQIQCLEEAIKQERIVQFQYTNNENKVKQTQVEPVRVIYQWFNWYLIAFHEKYQDYCMFKLVRMEHLLITKRKNTKKHFFEDIHLDENAAQEAVEIKLYGKSVMKAKCKEYLHGKITKEYENGDFEFCFFVPERETFWFGVILSFGSKVRIMEPQSVIDRILGTCRELLKEYE